MSQMIAGSPAAAQAQAAEEARLQLAVAGAAAERRNRPLLLVIGAVVLLLISGVYATRQLGALALARAAIGEEWDATEQIRILGEQIRKVSETGKAEVREPDTGVGEKLGRLATSAGLPSAKFSLTQGDMPDSTPKVSHKKYNVTIKDAPSQSLVQWLVQATGTNDVGLNGIEVNQIKVRPAAGPGSGVGWDTEIVLTRLERGS